MEKLRILYFCPQQQWPLNTGARLRNFHLANALGRDCSVTLLQVIQPGEMRASPAVDTTFEKNLVIERDRSYTPSKVLRGMIGPVPVTVLNYWSPGVEKYLCQVLNAGDFHSVQLESIHLFGYWKQIQSAAPKTSVVLDWHNIESELMARYAEATSNPAKRMMAQRTASLLARFELEALANCDAHIVVSEREKEKLMERCPSAKIEVIPNGVDTAAYGASRLDLGGRMNLLFVGSMDYHANAEAVAWFVREIWPKLALDFPQLDFLIVGRNPPAGVQALASKRIVVTGTVEDVRPYYQSAFAVIVPLRVGGGTRLKILEAMAAGVPVISTRLGAEGLEVSDRDQLLLADTSEEMRSAIREIAGDTALRKRLVEAGRKLVEKRYDWAALGKLLDSLHRNLEVAQSGSV